MVACLKFLSRKDFKVVPSVLILSPLIPPGVGLDKSEASGLMDYLKGVLAGKCWGVKTTPRLENHPCVVTVEEMASARHFVKTQFSQV